MRLFLTDLRTLVCVLVSDLPISKLHQCRGGGGRRLRSQWCVEWTDCGHVMLNVIKTSVNNGYNNVLLST